MKRSFHKKRHDQLYSNLMAIFCAFLNTINIHKSPPLFSFGNRPHLFSIHGSITQQEIMLCVNHGEQLGVGFVDGSECAIQLCNNINKDFFKLSND